MGQAYAAQCLPIAPNPEAYVVKVETGERLDFQNIAEWAMWQASSKALARWLAPCIFISPNGRVLLQARCEPCPAHMIPKKVPKVLADLHQKNFGILDGKVVLMDYGRNLALTLTANAKQMTLVDSWGSSSS